jgi:hypothetical protein
LVCKRRRFVAEIAAGMPHGRIVVNNTFTLVKEKKEKVKPPIPKLVRNVWVSIRLFRHPGQKLTAQRERDRRLILDVTF